MSTLAGARNVVVRDSTFNDLSTNVHHHIHMIATDDFELLDKKLPRAHRAHYNANSPAQRNACLENTREAILAELVTWAGDHMSNKIYWLSGMAGTGKTTIAYSFCEVLSSKRMLAANFFCSRLEAESSNAVHIFPTIAHQLARRFPSVSSALVEMIRDDPDVGYKIVQQNFKDLIVQPLRAAAADFEGTSFVVVIDALDECTSQSQVADLPNLSVVNDLCLDNVIDRHLLSSCHRLKLLQHALASVYCEKCLLASVGGPSVAVCRGVADFFERGASAGRRCPRVTKTIFSCTWEYASRSSPTYLSSCYACDAPVSSSRWTKRVYRCLHRPNYYTFVTNALRLPNRNSPSPMSMSHSHHYKLELVN